MNSRAFPNLLFIQGSFLSLRDSDYTSQKYSGLLSDANPQLGETE
jgi:hypothetical protein